MVFKKTDVQFHSDNFGVTNRCAAIDIKVRRDWRSVILPISLGKTNGKKIYTNRKFTHNWVEENISESIFNDAWQIACENGIADIAEKAATYFKRVSWWIEGRSGGWFVMDFSENDVAGWDAMQVSRWGNLVQYAEKCANYVPVAVLSDLYINYFEHPEVLKMEAENVTCPTAIER